MEPSTTGLTLIQDSVGCSGLGVLGAFANSLHCKHNQTLLYIQTERSQLPPAIKALRLRVLDWRVPVSLGSANKQLQDSVALCGSDKCCVVIESLCCVMFSDKGHTPIHHIVQFIHSLLNIQNELLPQPSNMSQSCLASLANSQIRLSQSISTPIKPVAAITTVKPTGKLHCKWYSFQMNADHQLVSVECYNRMHDVTANITDQHANNHNNEQTPDTVYSDSTFRLGNNSAHEQSAKDAVQLPHEILAQQLRIDCGKTVRVGGRVIYEAEQADDIDEEDPDDDLCV